MTLSSAPLEFMGQLRTTVGEMQPRQTIIGMALCKNCHRRQASFWARSRSQIFDHLNEKFGGRIRFHLEAIKSLGGGKGLR